MILAVAFLRVLFAPPALAAGAAQVYTNNGKLDLLTPYWTNGNAATSLWELVGGYNAYFNAVTSTLT